MTSTADATAALHAVAAAATGLAAEADRHRQAAEQIHARLAASWATSRHPASTDAQATVARGIELVTNGVAGLSRVAELVSTAANRA